MEPSVKHRRVNLDPAQPPRKEQESRPAIGLRVAWREGETAMSTARNPAKSRKVCPASPPAAPASRGQCQSTYTPLGSQKQPEMALLASLGSPRRLKTVN